MDFDLDRSLAILRRTPATLDALLRGLPDDWTEPNEGPDTWSPYDVLRHLVHNERVNWIVRARVILEHGESRTFDPFDRLPQLSVSERPSLGNLLDEFAALRQQNIREVEGMNLTPELLDRQGSHPAFGAVTLRQLLSTWTVHDLGHIAQITRVMAKQYREAVGPWRQYLPVLDR